MKGNMNLYYDKEADFLEINLGDYTEGYFEDIGEGVSKRIEEKTGKITGIAILSFKKRTERMQDSRIKLPLRLEIYS